MYVSQDYGTEMSVTESHYGVYLLMAAVGAIILCVFILQLIEWSEQKRIKK